MRGPRRTFIVVWLCVSSFGGSAAQASRVVYKPGSAPEGEAIIRSVWPDALERGALNVARCESGHELDGHAINGRYKGLYQMGPAEWRKHRTSAHADIFDRRDNAEAALSLYRSRGWRPWQCKP